MTEKDRDLRYLKSLRHQFKNVQEASTEIINLQAILNLPKATEHFLSDIHGEYESFNHIMKNGSGVIKRKIDEMFGSVLPQAQRKSLATLIYYPEEKLAIVKEQVDDLGEWYNLTLHQLVEVCKLVASKYTRSKVRKALPKGFEYVIDELLHGREKDPDKNEYYRQIIQTIISIGQADAFIIAIANLIQRLAVDHLHIIGDIYDRGPGASIVMDTLMGHHSLDIQWGNHDIAWMGAAAGNTACMANVLRVSARYDNLATLEEDYGINLRPLAVFAMETYPDDDCANYMPRQYDPNQYSKIDEPLVAKIHKAVTVIQFKLEGRLIQKRPEYGMEDRLLLDKVDWQKGTLVLDDGQYPLLDTNFPTVNPEAPYDLTKEEEELVCRLKESFVHSEKLHRHIRFLFEKGGIYNIYNGNLMFHGCIPMEKDGSFTKVAVCGNKLAGKAYLDWAEEMARSGFYGQQGSKEKEEGEDFLWYLWCGPDSPLFGKDKAATFERYFTDDKTLWKETKNPYYANVTNPEICNFIFKEFGLSDEESHIINGHVPVELKKGESPIKADGKLLVIDGGLSKGYQAKTGIAGYTLLYNSYGLLLASHEPFESTERAIKEELDIHSNTIVLEQVVKRKRVADTDIGRKIQRNIDDINELLAAYRTGCIAELLD